MEVEEVARPVPKGAGPPFLERPELPQLGEEPREPLEPCLATKTRGCLECFQRTTPARVRPGGWRIPCR